MSSGATLSGRDGFEKLKTDAFNRHAHRRARGGGEATEQEEEERRRAEEERQRSSRSGADRGRGGRARGEPARRDRGRRGGSSAPAGRSRRRCRGAREAAESRARALRDQKAEPEERRFHLTGQLAAVPSKENAAPADVAAMRRKERAELERARRHAGARERLGRRCGRGRARPAPDRTVAFSPDVAVVAAAAAEGRRGGCCGRGGARAGRRAREREHLGATDEIAAGFFDSTPDAFDDESCGAVVERRPHGHARRRGVCVRGPRARMLWLSLGSGGEETEPVASEAAVEEAAKRQQKTRARPPGRRRMRSPPRAAAQQADVRDAMNVAEDMAFFAEEVAEAVEVQDVEPVYTPPAAIARARPLSRAVRARKTTPRPRRASASTPLAPSAATACANAYNGGNYGDAISLCEAAARLNARDSNVYTYLGNAHFEVGNDSEAGSYLSAPCS